ncbi:hypothetical protein [Lysobacter gummosus]|uniref:hypothetical protein n=1 Tax=Lysobacter gummosus TaxID=262324 RepID=UPI003637A530
MIHSALSTTVIGGSWRRLRNTVANPARTGLIVRPRPARPRDHALAVADSGRPAAACATTGPGEAATQAPMAGSLMLSDPFSA